MNLKNKAAIVTGGTRGIGRATVFELARQGVRTVFTYLRSDESAAMMLSEIAKFGGRAEAVKADVRDYKEARRVVEEAIGKFGTVDILVNNAGITRDKALMMMEPSDWQDVIDTNLTGYFNMSKACIVTMMKNKAGNIVNISSVAGVNGTARQVNYSSAKAGIIGLTKALAKEVASYNIRVNAVAPGYIETDMTKDLKQKDGLVNRIPCGRFGDAKEVALAVAFLASDSASYITGQVIKVDGGLAI